MNLFSIHALSLWALVGVKGRLEWALEGDHCVIRTGRYGKIASASDNFGWTRLVIMIKNINPDQEYIMYLWGRKRCIYLIGSETLIPTCYTLSDESSTHLLYE